MFLRGLLGRRCCWCVITSRCHHGSRFMSKTLGIGSSADVSTLTFVCFVCRCNMWKERAEQYLPRGVSRKASTWWSTTATCCSSPTPKCGRRNMLRTLPPAATCTTSSTSARNTGPLLNFPFLFFSSYFPSPRSWVVKCLFSPSSVDATKETGRMGRLINHSKSGNCQTKLHDINGVPHLILVASRDIDEGEELLYDYGDRSKASIAAHPWLKY